MKNPESYSEALKELEEIVEQLETDDIAVDELLDKVKRSSELLHFCQDKLTKTEEEVKAVLQEMPQVEEAADTDNKNEEPITEDDTDEPGNNDDQENDIKNAE